MKTKSLFTLCFIILHSAFILSAFAQGTAFTYLGRLNNSGSPASGSYDFRFKLYFDSQGNSQAGSSYLTNAIAVGNGLFTTTIDFGAGIFTGSNYWLEVDVKTNGAANYTVLTPLQPLTPTPYAIFAANAGSATTAGAVSGAVPAASLTGNVLDARLSGNVALLNANQTFTGANTFNQDLSINGNLWLQGALNMRTDLTLTQPAPGPEGAQLMMGDGGVASPNGGTAWVIDNYGTSPNASLRFFRDNAPTLRLSTNALIYNNGTLYADGINNRVGIGTNNPQSALHVVGTVTASTFAGNWQEVTSTVQQADPNRGYLANNAAQVTITLPVSPAVGDVVRVSGLGAGGWVIAQNSGQSVLAGNLSLIGASWTAREGDRQWPSVASSSDGSKLVAVAYANRIYTSTDSGVSWTPRESSRAWVSVASSSDGSKLVAVVVLGQIYTSTDSGVSWTPRESSRNWDSVASSSDGSNLVAVGYPGRIYTSYPSSPSATTTPGTAGYLIGGQSTTLELQYIGNGQFLPLSHEGTIIGY